MFRHRPLIQTPDGVIEPVNASVRANASGVRTYLAGSPPRRFTVRALAWLADAPWATMQARIDAGWHWSQLGLDFSRGEPPKRARRKKLAGRTLGGIDMHRRTSGSLEYWIGGRWYTRRELAAGARVDGWSIADIGQALAREPEHFFLPFAERMAFAKRAEPRAMPLVPPTGRTPGPIPGRGRHGNPFDGGDGHMWTEHGLAKAHNLSPATIAQRRRRGLTGADLIAPAWSIRDMPPLIRDARERPWTVKHAESFLRLAMASHGRALASLADAVTRREPAAAIAGLDAAVTHRKHVVTVWRERVEAAREREAHASQRTPRRAPEGKRGWYPTPEPSVPAHEPPTTSTDLLAGLTLEGDDE